MPKETVRPYCSNSSSDSTWDPATMSIAARTACMTKSSWGRGAPQKAIAASPTNLSSVPPFFRIQSEMRVR